MIATRQVIALRPRRPTRALLTPLIIQQVNDWKVHALKLSHSVHLFYILQMSPNFFMLSFNKPSKFIRNLPMPRPS